MSRPTRPRPSGPPPRSSGCSAAPSGWRITRSTGALLARTEPLYRE
ncbi:MAG TPA: hypothetical protein VNO26_06520 [Candidatus Limnocylindria bacterium]|nr:hypothetical protein [Candidatus Limnocylindria bacterium]